MKTAISTFAKPLSFVFSSKYFWAGAVSFLTLTKTTVSAASGNFKLRFFALALVLLCFATRSSAQIYYYSNATNGAYSTVATNATGTALALENGAATPGTPCGTGFSAKSFPSTTTYASTLPAVEADALPNSGYQLNITGFSVGLRSSGSGPVSAMLAYSTDGGTTWINQGTNSSPDNGASCGTTTTATWTTSVTITSATNGIHFRVYGFNASSTGGNLQILNLYINGTVTTACTPPSAQATSFTVSSPSTSSLTVGWTQNSSSDGVVVVASSSPPNTGPTNGTSYTGTYNLSYTSAPALGNGFVVYAGSSGNTVNTQTVTGLTPGTPYYFYIYEYTTSSYCYYTPPLEGGPVGTFGGTGSPMVWTVPASGTYVVPSGVSSLTMYLWGGGGGGGATAATSNTYFANGGGGGGGACGTATAAVSAGQQYTITIGAGGTGGSTSSGNAGTGGTTTFTGTAGTWTALGGQGGANSDGSTGSTFTGGTGATSGTGTGMTFIAGGNGSAGNDGTSSTTGITGTGGGGAGSGSAGGNAAGTCSGSGGTAGGGTYPGGAGGYNTSCNTESDDPGVNGSTPGGGGSGNDDWGIAYSGGNGGSGQVVLVYTIVTCTAPTTQATSFSTNSITATTLNYSFTRGNGNNVMVIAEAGAAPGQPVSGTSYTANATYGTTGTAVGGGYCVYNGTAAGASTATGNIALSGLTCGVTYYFAVYEYNTTGTCYYTPALTGSATTTCSSAPGAAASPSPAASATSVAVASSLSWAASSCAVSYNVYFGTTSPGTYIGNQTTTTYTPSTMAYGTTYYWRIDAVNTCGTTTGTVWSFTTAAPTYCTPSSSSNNTYISAFSTTLGISNITNNGTTYPTNGYANYTSDVVSQYPGSTIDWSLTFVCNDGGTAGLAIWVDWNNDGVFTDAGDQVYTNTTGGYLANGTYTGSFTVPSGASIGTHRMRVMADYYAETPTPCSFNSTGPQGDAEDYTLTVVAACTAPTSVTLGGYTTPICLGYSPGTFTTTVVGGSPTTYTYKWYSTTAGLISGATGSTYAPGNITSTTGYYCAVSTGTSSGCTTNSSTQTITVNTPSVTNTPATSVGPNGFTLNGTD